MKCDECTVKKCDARDVLKRFNNPKLTDIVERNCNEFKYAGDKGDNSQQMC